MVAACSDSAHPVCNDEDSTQTYSRQFVADMIAAASRVTPENMRALQAEMDGIGRGDLDDFSGFCNKLDALRKKYGI